MAMADGENRYPEGNLFMDCQGSELKDLETLAKNRTARRNKQGDNNCDLVTLSLV